MKKAIAVVVVLLGSLSGAGGAGMVPPTSEDPALIVVISDLHLGPGRVRASAGASRGGGYHAMEDFRWSYEFYHFLQAVHKGGLGNTTLVVNGDLLELWQSPYVECPGPIKELGCSEEEVHERLGRILDAHRKTLTYLADFARKGSNRLVVVPGNHDAALLIPSVAERLTKALELTDSERLTMATSGYWSSPDGRIVVEHGHQKDEVNRYPSWPEPFEDRAGRLYLERPWGEQFVRQYYNRWEEKYPIIDNFSGEAGGFFYGIRAEGVPGTTLAASKFFKFLALGTSWRQFRDFLGGGERPKWDTDNVAAFDPRFVASGYDEPIVQGDFEAAVRALPEGTTLGDLFAESELQTLCESRWLVQLDQQAAGVPSEQQVVLCPQVGGDLGHLADKATAAVVGFDATLSEYLKDRLGELNEGEAKQKKMRLSSGRVKASRVGTAYDERLFVLGHTHQERPAFTPMGIWPGVRVVNSGAWQRVISPAGVEELGYGREEALQELLLEDLPSCYSLVWIRFDRSEPLEPQVVYWTWDQERDISRFTETCPGR